MSYSLATHHKGPLAFVTTDFLSEVAQRLHAGIETPGMADGAKGMGGHEVHKVSSQTARPLICGAVRLFTIFLWRRGEKQIAQSDDVEKCRHVGEQCHQEPGVC